METWKQHIQECHMRKRKCEFCDRSFTRLGNLRLHQYKQHGKGKEQSKQNVQERKCELCNKSFSRVGNLRLHQYKHHGKVKEQSNKSQGYSSAIPATIFSIRNIILQDIVAVCMIMRYRRRRR